MLRWFPTLRLARPCARSGPRLAIRWRWCGTLWILAGWAGVGGFAQPQSEVAERPAIVTRDQVDPTTVPLSTIAELQAKAPAHLPDGLVRVRGNALPHRARDLIEISDGTGTLFVQTSQSNRLPVGDRHDFIGRLILRSGQLILSNAQFNLLRRLPASPENAEFRRMESLKEFQRLTAPEADQAMPVTVRGTAIYVDRPYNTLMLEDGTAGTWVGIPADEPEVQPGDEIELHGYSAPGDFAPVIVRPRITKLGHAPLPVARQVTVYEFVTGRYDGRRVRLEGVIRTVVSRQPQLIVEMMCEQHRIELRFPSSATPVLPPGFIGAKIAVTGVCSAFYNRYQFLEGFRMLVSGMEDVVILAPGVADPFALPVRGIRDLIRFEPDASPYGEKHIEGTVLFAVPDQRLFLLDDTGTVEVHATDTGGAQAGDRVGVVGYPELSTFGLVLRDASIRPLGRGKVPVPLPIDPGSNRMELLQGEILQMDVLLRNRLQTEAGTVLILQSGLQVFDAFLPNGVKKNPLSHLQDGSTLRLTGVLQVVRQSDGGIGYKLILRSESDVVVLANPPWWTLDRALTMLGLLALLSAVVIAWISFQRNRAEARLRLQDEKMRQAQKMEAIGTLAGGIAHDFNNILTGILGHTELALMDVPADAPLRNDLEGVRRAAFRARDLVRQILTFSRRVEAKHEVVNLPDLLTEAVRLLRATIPTTIEISIKVAPGCRPVLGDSSQLHQVIMNLATNAFQAIREQGGSISLALSTTRLEQPQEIEGAVLPAGHYVKLVVEDDGMGMTPQVLRRIFEPYFTTKHQKGGSGLGLAVVQGIVRNHGGTIVAQSVVGQGTRMRVLLPACDEPVPAAVAPVATDIVRGEGRILIVDDEPMIAVLGKRMLENIGYEVVTAFSGSEALAMIEAEPRRFELVITDQTMPLLTGLSLLIRLKTVAPHLPVIITTGYSETLNSATALEHGAVCLMNKPFSQADLAQVVARALPRK